MSAAGSPPIDLQRVAVRLDRAYKGSPIVVTLSRTEGLFAQDRLGVFTDRALVQRLGFAGMRPSDQITAIMASLNTDRATVSFDEQWSGGLQRALDVWRGVGTESELRLLEWECPECKEANSVPVAAFPNEPVTLRCLKPGCLAFHRAEPDRIR